MKFCYSHLVVVFTQRNAPTARKEKLMKLNSLFTLFTLFTWILFSFFLSLHKQAHIRLNEICEIVFLLATRLISHREEKSLESWEPRATFDVFPTRWNFIRIRRNVYSFFPIQTVRSKWMTIIRKTRAPWSGIMKRYLSLTWQSLLIAIFLLSMVSPCSLSRAAVLCIYQWNIHSEDYTFLQRRKGWWSGTSIAKELSIKASSAWKKLFLFYGIRLSFYAIKFEFKARTCAATSRPEKSSLAPL